MFGLFDKMFDINDDGKLDIGERVSQLQFMDDQLKEE